jgi:hypothetical protein
MNNLYKDIVYKTISTLFAFVAFVFSTGEVLAQQYGQGGVVLGEGAQTEIVHVTVDAGVTETFLLVGVFFIFLSAFLYYFHKKLDGLQV